MKDYQAIFAIDPGNHTGVAWSLVPLHMDSIRKAMVARTYRGSETIEGDELAQAVELFRLWTRFKESAYRFGVPTERIDLVIEQFVLRGGQHAAGKDGTSPERVTWAFEGYRYGRYSTYRREKHYTPIVWQSPGQALTFGTRPRLEAWDAWVVGREHERTAYAHLALRVEALYKVRAITRVR